LAWLVLTQLGRLPTAGAAKGGLQLPRPLPIPVFKLEFGRSSQHELPRQMWEHDIDAGLNYLALLPTESPEALVDDLENAPSFGTAAE
jgi:hypothetical protein